MELHRSFQISDMSAGMGSGASPLETVGLYKLKWCPIGPFFAMYIIFQ